jgi:two-component system response regulator
MKKSHSILVADDNQNDLDLTVLALSEFKHSCDIETVNDGVEVLEYLRFQGRFCNRKPGKPDIILLDLKMPRMDGVEVLNEIKNDSVLKAIPVVIFSSSREEHDMKRCYDHGVNAYVVKPVDWDQFVTAIRKVSAFWMELNELP